MWQLPLGVTYPCHLRAMVLRTMRANYCANHGTAHPGGRQHFNCLPRCAAGSVVPLGTWQRR